MQEQQKKPMKIAKKHKEYILGPGATVCGNDDTGSWRLERPKVDFSECIKCRTCEKFCPADVINIFENREECVVIDFKFCKGCGICANECPKGCITMIPEEEGEEYGS